MAQQIQREQALHPLEILQEEHKRILEFLQQLQSAVARLKAASIPEQRQGALLELQHVVKHILEAENHHQREEQVLFPALETRGLEGPPAVMRHEHEVMRVHKRALGQLMEAKNGPDLTKLEEHSGQLASILAEHIFKENNILFPMASQVLDESDWTEVRKGFDRLGYCCFSPPPS